MDEAAIRVALTNPDSGLPQALTDEDIKEIATAANWAAVVLAGDNLPRPTIVAVQRALAHHLAGAEVEVRAGGYVYRGGAGFGEGRHVVAVLGGKGGVGKSTVAANLAVTLAAMGQAVGLLDGDLNAPDIHHLLGLPAGRQSREPRWDLWNTHPIPPDRWRAPHRRYGLEVTSIGFVIPEDQPPVLSSRFLVSALLRHLLFEVAWTADVVLIDAPPGTGPELQAIAGDLPLSGAVFVTTPQDLAQMDAERTLTLLRDHGIPVIGLVHNMAGLTCPHCAEEIDLFAQSSRLTDAGLPILGRIPFDVRLSHAADRGRPLVLADPRGPVAYEYAKIGHIVRRWLAQRDRESGTAAASVA